MTSDELYKYYSERFKNGTIVYRSDKNQATVKKFTVTKEPYYDPPVPKKSKSTPWKFNLQDIVQDITNIMKIPKKMEELMKNPPPYIDVLDNAANERLTKISCQKFYLEEEEDEFDLDLG